jgi:hypothetical protein
VARKLAVKRLSAVEIDPALSHQHEFHAGRLRVALGFGDEKVSGKLKVHVHQRDGTLIVDEGPFTLYDARQLTPGRSEWHLYYASKSLPLLVDPGDLLVLFRPDETSNLSGIVAAAGSGVESQLLELTALDSSSDLDRFLIIEPPQPRLEEAIGATRTLFADDELGPPVESSRVTGIRGIVELATASGRIPGTVDMAKAAEELLGDAVSQLANPDRYLVDVLQVETDLFFEIEKAVHESRLRVILEEGGAVPEVLNWAMGVHQARRSRRGQSLQLHFARLLDARKIPYTPQCGTEAGETPDFVMPGCAQYHAGAFPGRQLRMVACKSTSKERWRQILNEAERIPRKFLLTLDASLTPATIDQMLAAELIPHIPSPIISASYSANTGRDHLRTVEYLLLNLEAATL